LLGFVFLFFVKCFLQNIKLDTAKKNCLFISQYETPGNEINLVSGI